ncbi:MAG: hypothetical protein DGJ47_000310, partial [Rickettsiaceae bacterium]
LALIKTFAIFSMGYLARPFGGFILSSYADFYGRKNIFLLTTLLMSIATISIGLLPTYKQAGVISPLLLLLLRFIQGVSLGSEIPGATAITVEHGDKGRFGRLCGILWSGTSLGAILSVAMLSVLTSLYSFDEIVNSNIWRVPFLFGGILTVICYYVRTNINETPEFLECKNELVTRNIFAAFKNNKLNLLLGFSIIIFFAVLVIINIYFPVFISSNYQHSLPEIYSALVWSKVVSFLSILLFGFISDYYCKYKAMRYALIVGLLLIWPMHLLLSTNHFGLLISFFILYQTVIALYFTSALPILSRLFPTKIRCASIAIIYNFAFMITSTIPSICSLKIFNQSVGIVLITLIIISALISLWANIKLFNQTQGKYAN